MGDFFEIQIFLCHHYSNPEENRPDTFLNRMKTPWTKSVIVKDEKNLAFQESFVIINLYRPKGHSMLEILRIERDE